MLQALQGSLRIALIKLLFQTRAGLMVQYHAEARETTRPILEFAQLVTNVCRKRRTQCCNSLPLGILTLARDILPNSDSTQGWDRIRACVCVADALASAYIEGSRRDPRYTQLFADISRLLHTISNRYVVDAHEDCLAVSNGPSSNEDPVWLAKLQAAADHTSVAGLAI